MHVKEKQQKRFLADLAKQPWRRMEIVQGAAEAMAAMTGSLELKRCLAGWQNNIYAVWHTTVATEWGVVDHLWVRRHDSEPVRSWKDMQRLKREVLMSGAERFAVEVYPPDAEVVDSANMYHLWVMPIGFRLPFTLRDSPT